MTNPRPEPGQHQMFGALPPEESVYYMQPGPAPQTHLKSTQNIQTAQADITIPPEAVAEMMRSPELTAAMRKMAYDMASIANENVQTAGARYEAVAVEGEDGITQWMVQPANYEAAYDEAANSTLTVAMATISTQYQTPEEK